MLYYFLIEIFTQENVGATAPDPFLASRLIKDFQQKTASDDTSSITENSGKSNCYLRAGSARTHSASRLSNTVFFGQRALAGCARTHFASRLSNAVFFGQRALEYYFAFGVLLRPLPGFFGRKALES